MTRGPAEPVHHWIPAISGSVEVAEAAKATAVQVQRQAREEGVC
jgi:hypothetical protein